MAILTTGHRKYAQEYLCRVKFLNPLPDLPFDPKLIEYPLPADRFYKWSSNALIDNAPYPLESEEEISLDLVNLGHFEQILSKSKGFLVNELMNRQGIDGAFR
jgi:hypothetical protein